MATSFDLPAGIEQVLRDAFSELSLETQLTGVDFGFRYVNRQRTDELVLRFHVPEKIGSEDGLDREILPEQYRGYRTDLLSAPLNLAHGGVAVDRRTQRHNPLPPGVSVSHGCQGPGTLGAIVFRRADGAPALLSCWHVLAHSRARRGDPIYQPSPGDGGDVRFEGIGTLEDWLIDGDGDAAIALLNKSRILERGPLDTGAVLSGARRARLGEVLTKSGRGTNVTRALVDGIGLYQLQVGDAPPTLIQGFHLVPVAGAAGEISRFGDSGAIWFSSEAPGYSVGVGLHVDGEHTDDEPEFAIACHLPVVLERLKVSLTPPLQSGEGSLAKAGQTELPAAFITWAQQHVDVLEALTASLKAGGPTFRSTGEDHVMPVNLTIEAMLAARAAIPQNGGIHAH